MGNWFSFGPYEEIEEEVELNHDNCSCYSEEDEYEYEFEGESEATDSDWEEEEEEEDLNTYNAYFCPPTLIREVIGKIECAECQSLYETRMECMCCERHSTNINLLYTSISEPHQLLHKHANADEHCPCECRGLLRAIVRDYLNCMEKHDNDEVEALKQFNSIHDKLCSLRTN